jgi:hydrogenase-4 component F
MLLLLIVIFVAFLNHFRAMYLVDPTAVSLEDDGIEQVSWYAGWRVAPMVLPLVPLLVLGVWWPSSWTMLFHAIANALGARP